MHYYFQPESNIQKRPHFVELYLNKTAINFAIDINVFIQGNY